MTCSLVISGTHSGVGKTSVALGLMAALQRRGLKVQPFKAGPDYLDPVWHRLAAGRASYNLDTWMTGADYVQRLFREKSADADVAIVEGVMGLFDGASPTALQGSTAELAVLLGAPVLLIASAHGASRSFAATVKGFSDFEPECEIAAVMANFCGSRRHAAMLEEALAGSGLCRLAGWIGRDALPQLPSRHLGLRTPQQRSQAEAIIAALADGIAANVNLDAICGLADRWPTDNPNASSSEREAASGATEPVAAPERVRLAQPKDSAAQAPATTAQPRATAAQAPAVHGTNDRRATLAVAVDEAFDFYYPDNLELLQSCGLDIVSFSPLSDPQLPAHADGLYFGGGYPEEAAKRLSRNESMRQSVARFARDGNPVYAECGGMMYLAQALRDREDQSWPMVGLLPLETRMLERRKRLGYVETHLVEETFWGPPGTILRGHEFHYSEIVEPVSLGDWVQPYRLSGARGSGSRPGGFARDNVLASYVHQHFHSNPSATASLARALMRCRDKRCGATD